jgi:hypothetical protein
LYRVQPIAILANARENLMPASIPQMIANAAKANGVPPALALQVAIQESSLNPKAQGKAGEIGLFQLMPSTAVALGVTDPMDPAQNAAGGTAYLAQLYAKYGSWSTALIAYNWGEGNVDKYGASSAPASTQGYVQSALTALGTDYTATLSPASVFTAVSDAVMPALAPDLSPDDGSGDLVSAAVASNPAIFYIGLGLLAWYILEELDLI